MMKTNEMTVDEDRRNRIIELQQIATERVSEYVNDKLKNISFYDNGKQNAVVEKNIRILGVTFNDKMEAQDFLYNEMLRVAEVLIENRHEMEFIFPKGARHDFDVGPGAPFPTNDGWNDIFNFVEETYGNRYRLLLEEIVIPDANVRSKGYIPFSFFFPHITYNEVIGRWRR